MLDTFLHALPAQSCLRATAELCEGSGFRGYETLGPHGIQGLSHLSIYFGGILTRLLKQQNIRRRVSTGPIPRIQNSPGELILPKPRKMSVA